MAQNETKNNSTKHLIPSRASWHKEKLLMVPRSHYEERFTYYDSVQNASFTLKDFCTYYFGKETENKRKIYFETLKIHHKHLSLNGRAATRRPIRTLFLDYFWNVTNKMILRTYN